LTERIDVVNQALTYLGEDAITSLVDDADRARIMAIHYETSRDATLESADWSFAIFRFIPPLNATPPVYGASAAFDIPTNILRMVSVDNPKDTSNSDFSLPINSREQLDWVFERRQVICNQDVIHCRGIRRIEEEGLFSPNFVQTFAAMLAFKCALALTASAEIQANMMGMYTAFLKIAKSRDGQQGRSQRLRQRTLNKSR
jgi:hypothetical protein